MACLIKPPPYRPLLSLLKPLHLRHYARSSKSPNKLPKLKQYTLDKAPPKPSDDDNYETQVIIVGGSITGLSASLLLAHHGVPHILITDDNRQKPLRPYRALTARTLEMLTAAGLTLPEAPRGDKLLRAPADVSAGLWQDHKESRRDWDRHTVVRTMSMTGEPIAPQTSRAALGKPATDVRASEPSEPGSQTDARFSPHTAAYNFTPWDLKTRLREQASALAAGTRREMVCEEGLTVTQDASGVVARLERSNMEEKTYRLFYNKPIFVKAKFLIAADGAESQIRKDFGIQQHIRRTTKKVGRIEFESEELGERYLSDLNDTPGQWTVQTERFSGFITGRYQYGKYWWLLTYEDGQQDFELDIKKAWRTVREALGVKKARLFVDSSDGRDVGACVADTFQYDRIFLAGHAAHSFVPLQGGYGYNTGIHDAYNLTWKLAHVTSGTASPSILSTYTSERRPIAFLRHNQIFSRTGLVESRAPDKTHEPVPDDAAMELGELYRSTVFESDTQDIFGVRAKGEMGVIGAGEGLDLPPAKTPEEWRGQPGTRAPWLPLRWLRPVTAASADTEAADAPTTSPSSDTKTPPNTPPQAPQPQPSHQTTITSTLDLFGTNWVLLTEDSRYDWDAMIASKALGIKLDVVLVGKDCKFENEDTFRKAFGVRQTGAVLVRPDGIVAWRTVRFAEAAGVLRGLLGAQ